MVYFQASELRFLTVPEYGFGKNIVIVLLLLFIVVFNHQWQLFMNLLKFKMKLKKICWMVKIAVCCVLTGRRI